MTLSGSNLRMLREMHGLTQTDLAEALGITKQAVSQQERSNGEARIEILQRYADYFDVPVSLLVGIIKIGPYDMTMRPAILPGDRVVVEPAVYVPDGRVALLTVNGETLLRRVYPSPICLQVVADNSRIWPPLYFTNEEKGQVRIHGRAIEVRRSI